MTRGTEYTVGLWVAAGTALLGVFVLTSRMMMIRLFDLSPPDKDAPRRLEAIVSAAMAYGFYVAAALMAGAEFPAFMRDHLFDGSAPAALAGLLVGAFPREKASEALPWIQWPALVMVVFAVGGAVIFGLIGAAAVFVAGSSDFWPAAVCAALGGGVFAYGYGGMIDLGFELSNVEFIRMLTGPGSFTWPGLKEWFKLSWWPGTKGSFKLFRGPGLKW